MAYRKSGRDLLLSHPDKYEQMLQEGVAGFLSQSPGTDPAWAKSEAGGPGI